MHKTKGQLSICAGLRNYLHVESAIVQIQRQPVGNQAQDWIRGIDREVKEWNGLLRSQLARSGNVGYGRKQERISGECAGQKAGCDLTLFLINNAK
jgi:hypothetical protein